MLQIDTPGSLTQDILLTATGDMLQRKTPR